MKKVKTRAFSRFNANRAPSYGGTERRRGLQAQGEFFYAQGPPENLLIERSSMLEMKLDLLEIERGVFLENHDVEEVILNQLATSECLIELGRWQEALDHADVVQALYTWFGDTEGSIRLQLVRAKALLELREFETASGAIIDAQAMAAYSDDEIDWELLARVEEMRAFSHSIQGFEEAAEQIEKQVAALREILNWPTSEERG